MKLTELQSTLADTQAKLTSYPGEGAMAQYERIRAFLATMEKPDAKAE